VKNREIVLGVTASIAIYKACALVRALKKEGFSVTVIQTKESKEFVSPLVFQSLSGRKVYQGLFEVFQEEDVAHISLAKRASIILIAPATANIIAKIAHGICDDMLTCVVAATKAPVLIAPAMNENMYVNKITQSNIEKLKKFGFRFVAPKKGALACGLSGIGCLADEEDILKVVKGLLKR
jgi:phosphopantothenoylcysteine decarboxylase / phosphopantothenate---cysteine ligase